MIQSIFKGLTLAILLTSSADAFMVPKIFKEAAREHSLPATVFYAMIYHESKRPVQGGGVLPYRPWPWTLNHNGKGYYFTTKSEAINFAQSLLDDGEEFFDVGFGQINWHFHKDRLMTLENAFDPRTNLNLAASILSDHRYGRAECDSWTKAVGCYHRPARGPADIRIANRYANKVQETWRALKKAEREARLIAAYSEDIKAPFLPPARFHF